MQPFTPCLWYDGKAEEAAGFYTSVFKNSKITGITCYGKAGAEASGLPEGTVMTVAQGTEPVMKALMQMRKIDIETLKQAYV